MIDDNTKLLFQTTVRDYYHGHGRHDLPWRQMMGGNLDPYHVMVSELMLQQTQVSRVIPKYHEFLAAFPTLENLAQSSLADVLKSWSGLGYNRRAKFLWQAAKQIVEIYQGHFPEQVSELVKLPGIGNNTAGAITAYAYNRPVVFIETNIRTVYIHHFFHDQTGVSDTAILELVAETLESQHPRKWYWALMDYGAYLKQSVGNLSRNSKSYAKQSQFQGSRRQIRGQIIRLLSVRQYSGAQIHELISDQRVQSVLDELVAEQLIQKNGRDYRL